MVRQLIIIALACLMTGCGSRRKTVQSINSGFKFESAIDTSFKFSGITKVETLSTYSAFLQQSNTSIEYDGQLGDSLSVEKFGPDGTRISKTVVKGKGKATISDGQKQEQVQASGSSSTQEQSQGEASGSHKAKSEAFQEALDKTVSSTPGILSYWWLLLLVLGALWYLNKRYGWWDRLKSHVTAKKKQ
ncbi:MAG: hypothetical protein V4581_16670 [Bacteroidota bacterium]